MKNVTISVSLKDKSFESKFKIEDSIPEYIIADEAYALAMRFAHTRMIATFGHKLPIHQFSDFLKELNYNYVIEEDTSHDL